MADAKQDPVTARYSQAVRVKQVVDLPFPMAVDYRYSATAW